MCKCNNQEERRRVRMKRVDDEADGRTLREFLRE